MMLLTLADIFRCTRCGFWYPRDEEGPWQNCKSCYWGVPLQRDAIVTRKMVLIMMARELEELLSVA